ncbi:DUF2690 domain-containing protein [Micromonospora cathayae]|uniref:DUF2690 domain-containing protein n=1 Tax=Micromonospora cathayae TaxID=3028804 RepID=A0ABY7ZUX8_9ACTN|nr:DUF2690 domain-containing protein [Micromonospora sp. HUAS 3]WDZ86770.1 DUF2690 domain-containing protein [Micromonospora sp. HUAS 3]
MKRMITALALLAALVVSAGLHPSAAGANTRGQLTMAEMITENSTYIPEATLLNSGCGSACDFKDPATFRVYYNTCTGCYYHCVDDADDKRTIMDAVASIILRYSERCRTAWAKTTYSNVSYIKAESRYLNGTHRATVTEYVGNYTVMMDDADLQARACVQPSGPYSLTCTGWY